MAGLVAVGVLADQAGDVRLIAAGGFAFRGEQLVESLRKVLLAAHQPNQSADILRREKSVLPRIGFREIETDFARIEASEPAAVTAWPHEPRFTVEHISI